MEARTSGRRTSSPGSTPTTTSRCGSSASARRPPTGSTPTVYWGPYLLINTALNLVAGKELAWQDRKAESFILTPLVLRQQEHRLRRDGRPTTGDAT